MGGLAPGLAATVLHYADCQRSPEWSPAPVWPGGRPIAQWSRLEAGRSDDLAAWRRWPRPGTGWATARDSLTRGPCQLPTADARDGGRGNQPWSVITTPVSA
jgi:hypothetical protein